MPKKISDFILSVHDASMHLSPMDFHRWTLKEIRRYIDFDFAIWGAGDGQSRQLSQATILDQTDTLFETWEAVKEEDPFANLVIGNTGKTWSIEQLPDFHESRAYHEHWGRYYARQMISTMEVDDRTGLHIFVTLAREQQESIFTPQHMQMKSLITQHLFLAARHNDMHSLRTHQAPAALVDRHGILHAALPNMTVLLADEWGGAATRRLPENVTYALWRRGHYQNGRHLALNAERVGQRLLIRAALVPTAVLSEREKEVAWIYAAGSSHKEVAKTLGISPTTVRTHLARVYQKLGISDKGSLAIWLKDHV
ncbi:response regulator transcription factor [Marinimicrobium sp. ARAG 43.8]|uniref:helix-turn-helix transcriptional regulator n=1 Tax=Marinimicrobium sp. ARAG 43.8 TaxID=3418719 RepID=UPI003CF8C673